MTHETPAGIPPELIAERALRLAAECGNGLLSGAVVEVIPGNGDRTRESSFADEVSQIVESTLRGALAQMGARVRGSAALSDGDAADYVFVCGEAAPDRLAALMADRLRDTARLPPIFITVESRADADLLGESLAALDVPRALDPAPRTARHRRAAERNQRWRRREPRAQLIEFQLGGRAAALAVPAAQVTQPDARARITESAARIAWAGRGMVATAGLAAMLRESGAIRGTRVGVSLLLEPKTAALAVALRDAGAEVAVFSADNETDRAVATALAELGVAVFAPQLSADEQDPAASPSGRDETRENSAALDAENAAGILGWNPELLIDDGSHLIRLAHTERPEALRGLRAASEETTSGVRPLVEMAAEGKLSIPVIAVNDARTKAEFDNRIGTGQSCVFAIANVLDVAGSANDGEQKDPHPPLHLGGRGVSGSRWVVVGYGPVGVGVARFAAALGARITVVERDPVRALQALHDGHEAQRLVDALPKADVVVSATGVWHTLRAEDFALLRAGAAVAVAGGIDDELALDDLRALGWAAEPQGPQRAIWRSPGASDGPLVLSDGAGVNYTAGEGNPIEVMDLSFATQLSSLARITEGADSPGVHMLDEATERRVAAAALAAHGGSADPAPSAVARPGGAAQHWTTHRYRSLGG